MWYMVMSKRNITLGLAFIYFYYFKKKLYLCECTYDRHNRTSLVGYSYDRMKKKKFEVQKRYLLGKYLFTNNSGTLRAVIHC